MSPGRPALARRIREAAAIAPDSAAFRQAVLDAVQAHVPFDAACLADADPAALVPTSLTTVGYDDPSVLAAAVEIEYGEWDEPGRFRSLRALPVPIARSSELGGGDVPQGRRRAELLGRHGLRDEVRMVFRGRDGRSWGACTLARGPGRTFSPDEVAVLGSVLPDVGDGLRALLFRDSANLAPIAPLGPALAVVGADNELESVTPAAAEYLERLGWGHPGAAVLAAPAAAAAAWLRLGDRDGVAIRVRARDGEWLVLRAGRFDDEHPARRIALTIERAQPPEIVGLMAAAHGLSRREVEVLTHVLAGESRNEIARALCISPYTVQDHLKGIFAKTGVGSGRSLVAKLVRTQYLPRLGQALGADGFFLGPGQPGPVDQPGRQQPRAPGAQGSSGSAGTALPS
jgi:DNA-binding CsgD family transcriptional regulator